LESLDIPPNFRIQFLSDPDLVDKIFSSFTDQLDSDDSMHLCISIDAEWNISRTVGVSILQLAPHSEDTIFIIPVSTLARFLFGLVENNQRSIASKTFQHRS
jgi:hypothetical protein